jgi:predicted nucleotidyltransferase
MINLRSIGANPSLSQNFRFGEINTVIYHDCFDCPLSFAEIIKWKLNDSVEIKNICGVVARNGFCFLKGREGLIFKRALRQRISAKKMEIAQRASKIISLIPTVRMIAVTGSLAMENSDNESDIDLMVITKAGSLWTTRLFTYMVIHALGLSTRKPNDSQQKDKLCLNMWLDEDDLIWRKRNFYSAHEIAQIVPLVNKGETYEQFLYKNKWILNYWPNSVRISNLESRIRNKYSRFKILDSIFMVVEKLAFRFQYRHMKPRITHETVTSTRALFHPHDWSKIITRRLSP